ncbi:hypothetical protein K438DRAFT_1777236 [Mycena galopus ATCC 62051]|nr:hypothetical protein K438DRAFT_1777236 [Mycena galopus ATCC 62051]
MASVRVHNIVERILHFRAAVLLKNKVSKERRSKPIAFTKHYETSEAVEPAASESNDISDCEPARPRAPPPLYSSDPEEPAPVYTAALEPSDSDRPTAPPPAPPIYAVELEVGPMNWADDTAGQVRRLFDLMSQPYTGNPYITAGPSDERGFVKVQFSTLDDGLHFQNCWNAEPPAAYSSVTVEMVVPDVDRLVAEGSDEICDLDDNPEYSTVE